MIIWALVWLYFRAEFSIDWGQDGNLVIDWLPSISTTISPPDENGYRLWSVGLHFLIFGVVLSYYYPSLFRFDEEGTITGKSVFPECSVTQIE